jgi:hypothetical protein
MDSISEPRTPVVLKVAATDEKCDESHPKAGGIWDGHALKYYVLEVTEVHDSQSSKPRQWRNPATGLTPAVR